MSIKEKALALRIYIGEKDRADGTTPLYEAIVLKAREAHLAGATVFRSPMGFGHSSLLHTANILRLSDDLPMVVEIIDAEKKILDFLKTIKPIIKSGLATLEEVKVIHYGTE